MSQRHTSRMILYKELKHFQSRKFVYGPFPINLDDVSLDDDLTELQEAIAENAHEIWAKARTDQGWTYGPERNDQKKRIEETHNKEKLFLFFVIFLL